MRNDHIKLYLVVAKKLRREGKAAIQCELSIFYEKLAAELFEKFSGMEFENRMYDALYRKLKELRIKVPF